MNPESKDWARLIEAVESLRREVTLLGGRVSAIESAVDINGGRGRSHGDRLRPRRDGERGHQRGADPRHRRRGRGLPRQAGLRPADPPARLGRVGPAGPGHDPGIARAGGPTGPLNDQPPIRSIAGAETPDLRDRTRPAREERALKLKITVEGKVYEVDVEVAEPEPQRPDYARLWGQARIPAPPPSAVPPPTAAAGAPVADESKVCRSPLAGVVSRLAAKAGAVDPGQRHPARAGDDEDGDRHHGPRRRQGRQDQRQRRRSHPARPGTRRVRMSPHTVGTPRRKRP